METTYNELADRALKLLGSKSRVLILLVGIPGSGKSTVAENVVSILNSRYKQANEYDTVKEINNINLLVTDKFVGELEEFQADIPLEDENYLPRKQTIGGETIITGRCVDNSIKLVADSPKNDETALPFAQVVPMDGFHLSRQVLRQFKDHETAILRRGSPFTFDSEMVVALVKLLSLTCLPDEFNGDIPNIYVPDFVHKLKDPTPFGIPILSTTRILIIEGLYLLLKHGPWQKIYKTLNMENGVFNEYWKINVEFNVARERVANRHYQSKGTDSIESGFERFDINDGPNGILVDNESFDANYYIKSV